MSSLVCDDCQAEKPASEFPTRGPRAYKTCRGCCRKIAVRTSKTKHADKNSRWNKDYYARNKRDIKARKYGTTPLNLLIMEHAQGGRCAICGVIENLLHIDHSHRTGQVRGLLCLACNRGMGLLGDNPLTLMKAAVYLARRENGILAEQP